MNRNIEEFINYYDNVLSGTGSKLNKIYRSDIVHLLRYCESNIDADNKNYLNYLTYECIVNSLKAGIAIGYKAHTRDLQTKKAGTRTNHGRCQPHSNVKE